MADTPATAAILVVGNEILSGRTRDSNLHYLAGALSELGIRLKESRIVADEEAAIVTAVNDLRAAYTYVFTTGGIGPTHDDITASCVAKAFGVELIRDPRAMALLQSYYRPEDLNEMRLRMANLPQGADLIANPISLAPGFRIGNVHVMAGVPKIMQAMFESLRHTLAGGVVLHARTLTISLPEGLLAAGVADLQTRFGAMVEIGSYPFVRLNSLGTAVVLRSAETAILDDACLQLRALVASLAGDCVEDAAS